MFQLMFTERYLEILELISVFSLGKNNLLKIFISRIILFIRKKFALFWGVGVGGHEKGQNLVLVYKKKITKLMDKQAEKQINTDKQMTKQTNKQTNRTNI